MGGEIGPGCGVMERWIGAAGRGAVGVGAGIENVRPPRLPKLEPPPRRASAVAAPSINTAAAAIAKDLKPNFAIGTLMNIARGGRSTYRKGRRLFIERASARRALPRSFRGLRCPPLRLTLSQAGFAKARLEEHGANLGKPQN
jgi:hypothetical protein